LDSAESEGIAGDDFSNEGLHPVVVTSDCFHQVIHHNFVIAFQLAA
jgi:hypothetical protein